MCDSPCATCSGNNFYSCLTCTDSTQTLTNSLCITPTTMVYQIITTALMIIFIIPVLLRKRSLVLIKILDLIQICSYFKFIVGYTSFRHVYLYLNMRGWGAWEQGWQIVSGDPTVLVWTTEEGNYNKLIRIACTWGLFVFLIMFIGLMKVVLSETQLTFAKFMKMEIANTLTYAFYFTLQDLSFFVASSLLNPTFNATTDEIVCFSVAIIFGILIIMYILKCFHVVNFKGDDPSEKLFPYKYFFLYSADYDLFPTYNLTQIPTSAKQINKYSNLRIIDMIKKVIYSFLIVHFLATASARSYTQLDEIYQIFAFILVFEVIWFIVFPFDIKRQFLQFILLILSLGITLYLLFAPWYVDNEIAHIIMVLILFGLAVLSLCLEICLDVYKLIPVDLYDTGLKVIIDDTRLMKQLAMRKKEQEQMERKLKQVEQEKRRLQEEKKQSRQEKIQSQAQKSVKNIEEQNESEMSLSQNTLKNEDKKPKLITSQAIQKESMNSEEIAQLYKIDELKRRKVYQWNKKKPFTYSNKVQ